MKKETIDKLHRVEIEALDEVVRLCNKYNIEYFLIAGTLIGAVRHKGFIPWDDDLDIAMPRADYEKFIEIAKKELNPRFLLDCYETNKKYFRLAAKVRIKNTIYMEKYLKNYKGSHGIWIDILPLDTVRKKGSILVKIQSALKSTLQVTIMKKQGLDISNKSLIKRMIVTCCSVFKLRFLIKMQTKFMKFQNSDDNEYIVNFASKYGYKKQIFKKEQYFPAKELIFECKPYHVPNKYDEILTFIYGDYMKIPPIEQQEIHNPIKIKFEDGEEIIYEEI